MTFIWDRLAVIVNRTFQAEEPRLFNLVRFFVEEVEASTLLRHGGEMVVVGKRQRKSEQ
jgi:hypothetical protein